MTKERGEQIKEEGTSLSIVAGKKEKKRNSRLSIQGKKKKRNKLGGKKSSPIPI